MELCHYTNLNGLHGIIGSKSIWATNYSFLNDQEEFIYGICCLEEFLNGPPSEGRLASWRGHLSNVIDYIKKSDLPEIYSTSFCKSKDLLSQWRGYGQQGVCVVFDKKLMNSIGLWNYNSFNKLIGQEKTFIPRYDVYCNEVEYLEKGTEYDFFTRTLDKIKKNHLDLYEKQSLLDGLDEGLRAKLFGLIVPFIKNYSFREEGEFRVAALQVNNKSDIKFRCGNGLIIPYIELSVMEDKLPIVEVVIGPGANGALIEKGVRMLLNNNGYDAVNISRSSIPYRG
ncbi:DUF2971 domain-containing protein [Enterobacter asburiae]|uniref:DUF2971 domain-containing protein n=1 Tax=Enterobacter asburiae TaxID=61645 RepID=UPI0018C338B7|nr:DUF2971 domain-containing protein [Enterobacter asburiae]MBG0637039.1 DUF2971 domain-containing protein [Enterobacter asburiae]